jgi:hypothetical protein
MAHVSGGSVQVGHRLCVTRDQAQEALPIAVRIERVAE